MRAVHKSSLSRTRAHCPAKSRCKLSKRSRIQWHLWHCGWRAHQRPPAPFLPLHSGTHTHTAASFRSQTMRPASPTSTERHIRSKMVAIFIVTPMDSRAATNGDQLYDLGHVDRRQALRARRRLGRRRCAPCCRRSRGDPLDKKPSGRITSLPQLLSSLPRVRVAL